MSTPNATTFRFSEETREELERIKVELRAPTLQKTVEILIQDYFDCQNRMRELSSQARRAENTQAVLIDMFTTVRAGFKVLLEYDIPEKPQSQRFD